MAGESARDVAARSRAKAERLMRHAELYERGAEGEARTAAVLAAMPPEWVAIHDVRWPGRRFANIDHIVLGPGGIFVVDSKNWAGHVVVERSTLRQNGRSREQAVAGCADSALAISELLGPYAAYVAPVLCLVREERVSGWVRDVMICSTLTLPEMLLTRPASLGADERAEVWTRLNLALNSARELPAPRRPSMPRGATAQKAASVRRRPRQGRRTNGSSGPRGLVRLVVGMAMLFGLATCGPQLASVVGDVVSDQLTVPAVDDRQDPPRPPAGGKSAN